jgi:hypothetical protein
MPRSHSRTILIITPWDELTWRGYLRTPIVCLAREAPSSCRDSRVDLGDEGTEEGDIGHAARLLRMLHLGAKSDFRFCSIYVPRPFLVFGKSWRLFTSIKEHRSSDCKGSFSPLHIIFPVIIAFWPCPWYRLFASVNIRCRLLRQRLIPHLPRSFLHLTSSYRKSQCCMARWCRTWV